MISRKKSGPERPGLFLLGYKQRHQGNPADGNKSHERQRQTKGPVQGLDDENKQTCGSLQSRQSLVSITIVSHRPVRREGTACADQRTGSAGAGSLAPSSQRTTARLPGPALWSCTGPDGLPATSAACTFPNAGPRARTGNRPARAPWKPAFTTAGASSRWRSKTEPPFTSPA